MRRGVLVPHTHARAYHDARALAEGHGGGDLRAQRIADGNESVEHEAGVAAVLTQRGALVARLKVAVGQGQNAEGPTGPLRHLR